MKIKLYSTGCPKCKVLKAKLNQKSIQFCEVNDTVDMLARGITEVPVLEVDGVTMLFKEAVEWVNKQ